MSSGRRDAISSLHSESDGSGMSCLSNELGQAVEKSNTCFCSLLTITSFQLPEKELRHWVCLDLLWNFLVLRKC